MRALVHSLLLTLQDSDVLEEEFRQRPLLAQQCVHDSHGSEAMEMGYRHGRLHHRSRHAEDSPKLLSEHAARASRLMLPCQGSGKSRSTSRVDVAGPGNCCVPGLVWVADDFLTKFCDACGRTASGYSSLRRK